MSRRRPRPWVDLALVLLAILLGAALALTSDATTATGPGLPPPTGTTTPGGGR